MREIDELTEQLDKLRHTSVYDDPDQLLTEITKEDNLGEGKSVYGLKPRWDY